MGRKVNQDHKNNKVSCLKQGSKMNVFSIKQGQGLKASGHTSLPKLSFSAPRACITLHVS